MYKILNGSLKIIVVGLMLMIFLLFFAIFQFERLIFLRIRICSFSLDHLVVFHNSSLNKHKLYFKMFKLPIQKSCTYLIKYVLSKEFF